VCGVRSFQILIKGIQISITGRGRIPLPKSPPQIRDSPLAELHQILLNPICSPALALSRSGDAIAAGRSPRSVTVCGVRFDNDGEGENPPPQVPFPDTR